MSDAYFQQAEQKVRRLLQEKKYKEAHVLCKNYLQEYPFEKIFLKLKDEIEEGVAENNQHFIMEKIDQLKPLIKEEKYPEVLEELKKLLQIDPNNKKAVKLYRQIQSDYQKQIQKIQEDFNRSQETRLEELLNKNPQALLQELFILENNNPGNPSVFALTAKFRDRLIAQKIKEKEDLIYSEKYDAINHFVEELNQIDKKNPRIAEIVKISQSRQHFSQLHEKEEFIYRGEKHIDTLMKLKKYDKAIKAANEILAVDKQNKRIGKLLEKARQKLFGQSREESIDAIEKSLPQLKSDFEKEPDKFTSL